ncbi:uncharacterized protein LOC126817017 [Patella vulgata]|uniref:uncharacterized protein LOC126817017 n=1 Tax=Patella vulgata TaxID=6465 RepID=UPI00217F3DC9|nr:uncharacterized protein LOC126817017 [Patella vulgata]
MYETESSLISDTGDTHNFQTESSVMSDTGDTHQIQTESSIMSDSIGTQLFQGKITHIIDPSNFWAQIGTESDTEMFKELEEELKIFCESVGVLNKDSNIGLVDCGCYVLVKQGESWHRAQVSRVDELKQRLDVSYVDHGDTDMVHINNVCVACPRIFYSLKPQAVKCQLVGIKPLANNWTNRGIKCFKNRTKDQLFQTAIVSIDQQFMFTGVSLYYSNDQGRSLAYDLIDEEIGMPSDVNVPEFARDVRSALPESYLEDFQYDTDDQLTQTSDNYSPLPFDQSVASNSTDPSNPTSAINSPAEFYNPSNPETLNIDISNFGSTQSVQKDLENKFSAKPENYINDHDYLNVTVAKVDDKSDHTPCKDNQNNVETTCEHQSGAVTPCNNQSNHTSPEVKTPTHRKLYTDSWSEPQTPTSGTEPPSPDLAIPGFNLSAIMKTKSVCAGDLQEERDVHRRVTTKTEIVDNMEQIYDRIEYNNDFNNIHWGMSDLNISVDSGQSHDVIDDIRSQIDAIQPKHQYIQTAWENSHRQPDAISTTTGRVEQDSVPVLKLENSEEAEYKFSKQLAKLIKNIANEDPVIVCERIHQVVPPDGSCEANVLSVCLEMLIDEAMSNKAAQDAILKILDSYSHCDIFGACIEWVVKKLTRSYIKRPIRRTVHTDFSHILAQLFLMSKYWPVAVASLVQDFIISTLWKWIIFNKSGQQVGKEAIESCELYLSCLETVWSTLSTVIYELYPDKHELFLKDLLDKLLGDKITRNVRTRLFKLYMVSKEDILKTTESAHSNVTSADSYITKAQLKSDASSQTSPCLQDTQSTNTDDLDIKDWMKETLSTFEVPYQVEEENEISSSYFDFDDVQFDFGNGGYQNEQFSDKSPCFDHHDDGFGYGDNNNRKHEIIDKRVEAVTIKRVISFSDIRKNEKYHGKSGNESDSSTFSVNSASQEPVKSEETNKNSNRMDVESVSSEVTISKPFSHSEVNNNVNNQRDTVSPLPSHFNTKSKSTKTPEKEELPVKKKHKNTPPKPKQYHSWAECVKLEKSSSENLQADHLKHLAMQTLQLGVLKGKNIKARRQLSTEELKVMSSKESRSKPVTKSNREHCKDNKESKPISVDNDINNIKTLKKDKDVGVLWKKKPEPVFSKPEARLVPEGKFLQPRRAQESKRPETFTAKSRRLLKGKDLPMKAKLTREMLEEQLEKEVMMKFAPKSAYAISSSKTPVKPKPKTNPESEWPSLKPKVSPPQKTIDTTSSNSLQSIAAALLETPTSTEVGRDEEKLSSCTSNNIKNPTPSEELKGGHSTAPVINNSDSSSDVKGEETSTSRSYFEDSDDEWESDDSQDNFIVSGPADKFQMDANKAPTYQPVQRTWNPRARTCTSCGETSHVVYDCPNKASIIF